MSRAAARAGLRLAAIAVLAAGATGASAQVFLEEVPEYKLSGTLLVSYLGNWDAVPGHLTASHQLSEGLALSLSGWIYQSRLIKFQTYVLALRLDDFGAARGRGESLGYGASLRLLSGSILPVTLSYGHGLAVTGSTLQAAGVTSTTTLQGIAQLVSPVLPRVDVRVQRLEADDVAGARSTTDTVTSSVYGASTLHSYSALATWQGEQVSAQPRTTTTLASINDEARLTSDTRTSFGASLTRSTGLGDNPNDVFTSYAASGGLTTRLSPGTLFRGQYGFSTDTGPDREQSANQAALGATIDLRPVPVMLGEGLSGVQARYSAPGLDRTVDTVLASQGVATQGRRGTVSGSLSGTGQAGYSTVSDGTSGSLYGYGFNAALNWAVPQAPVHASAFYNDRVDHSSAGNSQLAYGTLASSNVARWYPLFLIPTASYTHLEQRSFFAEAPGGAGGLAPPMTFQENDTFTASLTGISPLYGTRLSFAGGFVDSSSRTSGTDVRQVFGRAEDAFRLAPRTFGNLALNASHVFGQGTNVNGLASLVWAFRESTLSLTSSYGRAIPSGTSEYTLALLFTRTFSAHFLPEAQ
jgi:hypothetical protein